MFKLTAQEKAHAAELLANTNFKVVLFKREGGISMKRALFITLGLYVGGLTAYYTYHTIIDIIEDKRQANIDAMCLGDMNPDGSYV